jgi:hypothetical protein
MAQPDLVRNLTEDRSHECRSNGVMQLAPEKNRHLQGKPISREIIPTQRFLFAQTTSMISCWLELSSRKD